ncbi:hypothetical protein HAX54_019177, partial [Datura stramonium]|nr:hypothetical protein [Datura stramonium]
SISSQVEKGKVVETSSKGTKRLRKRVVASTSVLRALPARRFGVQDVGEHGLKWFNTQKEA